MLETSIAVAAVAFILGFALGCRRGRSDERFMWRMAAERPEHHLYVGTVDYTVMPQSVFFREYHNPLVRARRP